MTKKVNQEITRSFREIKGSYLDGDHVGIDVSEPNLIGEKTATNPI